MFKLIVTDGQTFNNYDLLCDSILEFIASNNAESLEIVSSDVRGADNFGVKSAEENDILVKHFPSYWDLFGKSAAMYHNSKSYTNLRRIIATLFASS